MIVGFRPLVTLLIVYFCGLQNCEAAAAISFFSNSVRIVFYSVFTSARVTPFFSFLERSRQQSQQTTG
jgi:hypothetical protein